MCLQYISGWHSDFWLFRLGCPRNNHIFFRFEPKQTETQSVSVVFWFVSRNKKHFFRFVSDRYRNNRNKQNLVETNRKNLQKMFSIRGSSKPLIFFLGSNQNKPKLNLFWLFFSLVFRKTKKFFLVCFGLFLSRPLLKIDVWRILVLPIPLVYDGNRFLRFLY